jgi:hypothetical protein
MSREQRRGKTGWWLLALIALILSAAGIRYASSSDWWANTFNRDRQNLQTVNTGASVQVAASTGDRVQVEEGSTRPGQVEVEPPRPSPQPGRRMW